MSLSDAVGPDAPDPYELLSWYAEMGVTEALDETPRNHFADPVAAGGNALFGFPQGDGLHVFALPAPAVAATTGAR